MYKSHLTNSPMVVRSLEVNKDSFRPCEKNEELLGLKVPSLSVIGVLMYLANCTHSDIAFFINKLETQLTIIAIYVDDFNLIRTLEELTKTTNYLKKEFEMKDLGKTRYCLGLQIKHCSNDTLVHQSTYIEKNVKTILYGQITSC